MIAGRNPRRIRVGNVAVGGGAPVSVQSMTNTDTKDVRATLSQIRSLARGGGEIVRIAVPPESRPQRRERRLAGKGSPGQARGAAPASAPGERRAGRPPLREGPGPAERGLFPCPPRSGPRAGR